MRNSFWASVLLVGPAVVKASSWTIAQNSSGSNLYGIFIATVSLASETHRTSSLKLRRMELLRWHRCQYDGKRFVSYI
jgi:hypothetical protein